MERPSYDVVALIIDSEDPVYAVGRNTWRAYMNLDSRILCLFLRSSPECPAEGRLDLSSNTLFVQGTESLIPGILEKTLAGFDYCLRNFTFQYILRTNISSFYVFPLVRQLVLPSLPRSGCYAGVQGYDGGPFASGAGFFVSPDVATLLLERRQSLSSTLLDDLAIGRFLQSSGVPVFPLQRFNFIHERDTYNDAQRLAEAARCNTYHFRVKNEYNRAHFDPHYMRLLLQTYYSLSLTD